MKSSQILIDALKVEIPLLKEEKIPTGFSDSIDRMFANGLVILDRERFNILASYWALPPVNKEFFDRYFTEVVDSVQKFKADLDKFITEALWHFGDLERSYVSLSDVNDAFTC
ncbi:MAG: hypothetical protein IM584_03960 [Chitinophagaceae bacterium]|uniref:hypothetical protein n=1 Tax=Microcystis sp. M57BS1 TaxID=2771200 RepID=UPI00258FA977|nr:hypothetical protein [Microcystis sp. M57BS1]MCA2536361.1 hypothetical protein [Microcystis sp. M57BS1]MCA6438815.1 hypothetical protein [Chitinophagaceae bacterium]MCA6455269.1 hypothetical protein [Chitinophagaceae bacterium]